MNYTINHRTGEYSANGPIPTGIPSDPILTAHGVNQAEELGEHLESIEPAIDTIFCSPYYRCLQTLLPTARRLLPKGKAGGRIKVENGFGEFHGRAWFAHPSPALLKELDEEHFPDILDLSYKAIITPDVHGETIDMLHDRLAYALHKTIEACDKDSKGPRTILICSHAASIIAMGRVLTGNMPENFATDDFQCYTAGLSVYKRRRTKVILEGVVGEWDEKTPDKIPQLDWKGGKGVMGGWDCLKNSDCSFLSGGAERGWLVESEQQYCETLLTVLYRRFHDDEAFLADPNSFNDALAQAKGSRL